MHRAVLAYALVAAALGACGASGSASGDDEKPVPDPVGNASGNGSGGGASMGGASVSKAGESASGGRAVGGTSATGGSAPAAGGPSSCAELLTKPGAASQWAYLDDSGKVAYSKLDTQGNRLLDYSFAGYRGGGVRLPEPPPQRVVEPSGEDDTATIQAAIDAVSAMPLLNATRGAVLLAPGTFRLRGTVTIEASGVVLRGSGSEKQGTRIELTGAAHRAFAIAGVGSWKTQGKSVAITDTYLPVGTTQLTVSDATGLKVGDGVLVEHPVTTAWVQFMKMDKLAHDGTPQTWLPVGTPLQVDRQIAKVEGKVVTLDVPLADAYDSKYLSPPGADLVRYSFAGRISESGVEHLRIVAPDTALAITEPQFTVLSMDAAMDSWVRDVVAENTVNSLTVHATCKRVTVEDFDFSRASPADGSAGYPLEIRLEGTQTLVQRTKIVGDNVFSFSTGGRAPGPNVFLNCSSSGANNRAEPHMRWATGLLSDNMSADYQINYVNRRSAGTGQGWALGWGVIWNSAAGSFKVEQPPGSQNLCIGCTGEESPSTSPGLFEAPNTRVSLDSLYLAQLCDRLGPAALQAIGP